MSRLITSLKTNIHESSLVWEIENFLDYSHSNSGEISSEIVEFKDFNASWQLFVFPKTKDDKIALKFKILSLPLSNGCKEKPLLKLDVRTAVAGNDRSEFNHDMGRTQGTYSEPVLERHPALWSHDYMPASEKMELWCEDYIDHKVLASHYLSGGSSLKIYAEAFLKLVEVVNYFKE